MLKKNIKKNNKVKKSLLYKSFLTMFFLGIASGLPLSLILSTLKALLIEKGFDIKMVGFFALATIPYSLKFLYAPIIDSCKIPLLTKMIGHRKSWIIAMQLLLVIFISLLGFSTIFNNILYISIFALLCAFASASQDIVIDGYRIELFDNDDQGLASGFYIYGYRIGLIISGAGALVLASFYEWNVVYYLMAAILFCAIIVTLFIKETRSNFQKSYKSFSSWFRKFIVIPLSDIIIRKENSYLILSLIFFFKLSDAFAGNLILPFLLNIGYTKIQIAGVLKTFGLFAILFGVLAGGLLIKKFSIHNILWLSLIVQMLSNLGFSYLANIDINIKVLYIVVFCENFSGGIGDATLVAYLSSLCNKKYGATQYALLFSFAAIARTIFSSSAGVYAENLGWYQFFIFSTILTIPALIFLYFLSRKKH